MGLLEFNQGNFQDQVRSPHMSTDARYISSFLIRKGGFYIIDVTVMKVKSEEMS